MPKAFLKSKFYKSTRHVINNILYFDRQSPIFGLQGEMNTEDAIAHVIAHEQSQKWRHIYSMTSEDVERLAVDRDYMKDLVAAHRDRIAKVYNISPQNLQVVASFHEKDHHPHLHMILYSTDKREGFIRSKDKAEQSRQLANASRSLKSVFTNQIFAGDVEEIKKTKATQRDQLNEQTLKHLQRITRDGYAVSKELLPKMKELQTDLSTLGGRQVYGYLPPELKSKVDDVVFHIFETDRTAAHLLADYATSQRSLVETYADSKITIRDKMRAWEERFFHPGKGDDTTRHNMVIRAAKTLEQMGNKKENVQRTEYINKHPTDVAKSMIWQICKNLAKNTESNQRRQEVMGSSIRNQRMKKVEHRLNRETAPYEQ